MTKSSQCLVKGQLILFSKIKSGFIVSLQLKLVRLASLGLGSLNFYLSKYLDQETTK